MLVAAICCLLLLAGCGPERSGTDPEQLADEAQNIALAYAGDQDINVARAQIDALDVPNPKQWFLLFVEDAIVEGGDPNSIAALVSLADALGLRSTAITDYARLNNLLDDADGGEAEAIVIVSTPAAIAETGSSAGSDDSAATDDAADDATTEGSVQDDTSAENTEEEPAEEPAADATEEADDVALLTPTETPESAPSLLADTALNVRRGPSLLYDIVGGLQPGEQLNIVGKNGAGDWWQVILPGEVEGWVYSALVRAEGDVNQVAVIDDIPPPPEPTAAPEPAPAPAEEEVVEEPGEEPVDEEAPPPSDQPHFTLVKTRLWEKAENDGCAGKHLLRIHVLDANGNRLNGVALQGIYIGEILVTGSQGKGDGIIEYDLHGSGEGFRVIRDADGREATSDGAEGFTTRSVDIPHETLIGAGYCTNTTDCDIFYGSWGCQGHHSWEAEFRRNY